MDTGLKSTMRLLKPELELSIEGLQALLEEFFAKLHVPAILLLERLR